MFEHLSAEPEDDDEDIYTDLEESLCIAQLVSSLCVEAAEDAGTMTGRLVVT
jgi:hypothetical protein